MFLWTSIFLYENLKIVPLITRELFNRNLSIVHPTLFFNFVIAPVAEIIRLESKALAAHCHCHSLNLSVKSITEQCQLLRDTLDTVREICMLVKYSPKREKLLGDIQDSIEGEYQTTTLDKMYSTRWTVRAGCYRKIVTFYDAFFHYGIIALKQEKWIES